MVTRNEEKKMSVEVEVKEIAPCKKQFNIFVPAEEIEVAFGKSLLEVAATVSLPGFRKGKVPKNIIEKRYGKELEGEVQGQLVSEHYHKALEDNKWKALAEPKVDDLNFDRKEGFRFSATVEIYPEIELKEYKGIKLIRPVSEVSKEELENAVNGLRRERATLETSEVPSAKGDHLTVSAEFVKEGEVILTREHAHLHAGHNHLAEITVDGLGEAVIGKTPEEEIELEIELNESFPLEEHRGQKIRLKLKVEEIKTEKLPELDEDFLKPLQVKDVAELEKKITESIKSQKDAENEDVMAEDLLSQITKDMDIPVPEDMLKRQSLNLVQQSEAVYQIMQVPEEEREKFIEEEVKKVEGPATVQVRNFFVLDAIAQKEKIFVTEKEIAEHIYHMAMSQGKSMEELTNELRQNGGMAEIRMGLRERKTVQWLLKKADIAEGTAEPEKKKTTKKKKADKAE